LNFNITATASHFQNKIVSIPDNYLSYFPGDVNHSIVGHSPQSIFGYETNGIFQSAKEAQDAPFQPGVTDGALGGAGRLKYVDLNGNDTIDVHDQTWLGTTLPKLEYGIRIDLTFRNWDFSIFGSGVAGKTGNDPTKFFNDFVDQRNNFGPGTLSAWTPQNTGSAIPALSLLNHNNENRPSNFYYVNASYFKIRNVTIGYNLPKNIAAKIKMDGLRIYVMGQNLVAFKSKAYTAKDPERANTFDLWPVPTSYTVGINVNF
jgi:hypothetical protein